MNHSVLNQSGINGANTYSKLNSYQKKKYIAFLAASCILLIAILVAGCSNTRSGKPKVLVFSKTAGYRHGSIPDGKKAIQKLGQEHGFIIDTTENAAEFNEENLKKYAAVIFLSTTHDVLNNEQQADFKRYIQAGGGYLGIHAASDTEYHWPWYGKLVGAYFKEHPHVQEADLRIHKDDKFPVMDSLPDPWVRTDEWYDFYKPPQDVHVLVNIDESSYEGGETGNGHPMVWYHQFDGGRSFYMELGHTKESYTEPNFLKLLLAGINYAIGDNEKPEYSNVRQLQVPDQSRFTKKKLVGGNFDEPTEIAILPDLDILIAERKGDIKFYDATKKTMSSLARLDVYHHTDKPNTNVEMGLLGIQVDPHFKENHWVYVYYSPTDKSVDRLSRFKFEDNQFDKKSEQAILEVPTERAMCCHTGGSIAFDAEGNLYVSAGDNTTPFDETNPKTGKPYPINSHGYAPLDDRPGFEHYDDGRAAGNANDLRGKILRIKVNEDGSYDIPKGNLFPPDKKGTKPEIYVMGDRNPYRISIDQHTGYLYWGEVGPDANNDSLETHGPRGYDEVNQARKAGNFGWPFFIGDNIPYRHFNYETGEAGTPYDPEHPVNDSRNNDGIKELPPAQSAFIWYPYAQSEEFPSLGSGGRTAMAGPVYYTDDYPDKTRYPKYYDGKLFIYDWIRNWIKVVTMNDQGDLQTVEPFMPQVKFHNISDMEVGPDGRFYEVEYGTGWFTKNSDSGLYVIEYNGGNRPPEVALNADRTSGSVPFTIHLRAEGTKDPDGDQLNYVWNMGNGVQKKTHEPELDYEYSSAGKYPVTVTANDGNGGESTSSVIQVYAGNERPVVNIDIQGNKTFYFPDKPIIYKVHVNDREDGGSDQPGFDKSLVKVQAEYLRSSEKTAVNMGHMEAATPEMSGKTIMESLDCQSCHKVDSKSIGPSFSQVASKYKDNSDAGSYLPRKIIKGGSGVWGDVAMSAHPGLSQSDAEEIVRWILTLSDQDGAGQPMPLAGTVNPSSKFDLTDDGIVFLTARYSDNGANGISSLTGVGKVILRNPLVRAVSADDSSHFNHLSMNGYDFEVPNEKKAWLKFSEISLQDVQRIKAHYAISDKAVSGWRISVHLDQPDGKLLGEVALKSTVELKKQASDAFDIDTRVNQQPHDVYFVLQKQSDIHPHEIGLTGFQLLDK